MRCVVLGLRNALRCEIWRYGDMVIWPALQARAFALVIIFNCAMVRRRLSSSSSSFVFPKKSAQLCTLLLARARAACGNFGFANATWICVLDLEMRCLEILELQMYFCFLNTDTVRSI